MAALASTEARRRDRNKHADIIGLVQAHPRHGLVHGEAQGRVRRLEGARTRCRWSLREDDSVLTQGRSKPPSAETCGERRQSPTCPPPSRGHPSWQVWNVTVKRPRGELPCRQVQRMRGRGSRHPSQNPGKSETICPTNGVQLRRPGLTRLQPIMGRGRWGAKRATDQALARDPIVEPGLRQLQRRARPVAT